MKNFVFILFSIISFHTLANEDKNFLCMAGDSYCKTPYIQIITDDNTNLGSFSINGSTRDYIAGLPISDIRLEVDSPVQCEIEYQLNFKNKAGDTKVINEGYKFDLDHWENLANAESNMLKQEEYADAWRNGYSLKSVLLTKTECERGSFSNSNLVNICHQSLANNSYLYFSQEELKAFHRFLATSLFYDGTIEINSTYCDKIQNYVQDFPSFNFDLQSSRTLPAFLNLKGMKSITQLHIYNSNLSKLDSIAELKNLDVLTLSKTKISNLELISALPLIALNISSTPVKSLAPLFKNQKLVELDISNTSISNLDEVSQLKSLLRLNISGTPISNLTPISDLKKINNLNISNTPITDVNTLRDFKELYSFHLSNTNTNIYDFIRIFDRITFLNISNTHVENLDFLPSMYSVFYLDISNNPIKNYTGLTQMKMLKEIVISKDQEQEIKKISLPNIKITTK